MKIMRVFESGGQLLVYDADELLRDDSGNAWGAEVHTPREAVAFHEESHAAVSRLLTGVTGLRMELQFPPGSAGAVWVAVDADDARIAAELDAARVHNSRHFDALNARLAPR